jgi:hypothetical protein
MPSRASEVDRFAVSPDSKQAEHATIRSRLWPIARRDHLITLGGFAIGLGYATLRYNIFKEVPWADWPTYIVNKALGLASLILMALTVKRWLSGKAGKTLMQWSGVFAGTHVVLSLTLLNPDYYPKFYDAGKLTLIAGLSMLLGATAIVLQELGARRAKAGQFLTNQQMLGCLVAITGLHAALPGVSGWFAPATWPGYLPPITLISALVAVLAARALMPTTMAFSPR